MMCMYIHYINCWLQLSDEEQAIIQGVKEKIVLLKEVIDELQADEECIERFIILCMYIYNGSI